MKRQSIKLFDKMVTALLTLIGVSSCIERVEYGVPHADYWIKGTVTNAETQKAIENIHIAFGPKPGVAFDTLYSDENGAFKLGFPGIQFGCDTLHLKVFDADGTENGGLFAPDSTMVTCDHFTQTEKGKGWDMGTYETHINFTLKPQKTNEEQKPENNNP